MNTLTTREKESIWVPKLVFLNTKAKENTKNDDKSFVLARRDSTFKFSETDVKDNIYIFSGSDNPFVMSRSYDVEWICDYDMRWYPFDSQTCTMVFVPEGNSGEFVELVPAELDYLGPKDLTQYFIRQSVIKRTATGYIHVEVVLGRRLLGTILTVYIPSLLLVIIAYMTNYFKAFFFEAVVSVNLTVTLVNLCINH